MGSCRREILDHVIALNEQHLRRLVRDYVSYYNYASFCPPRHVVDKSRILWSDAANAGTRLCRPIRSTNCAEASVSSKDSRAAWARLIAKVYEADPLICRHCGSPMRIMAVITEPQQVRKILLHLIKTGKAPPGLDPTSLN